MAHPLSSSFCLLSSQFLSLHSNFGKLIGPNYSVNFRTTHRRSRSNDRSLNVAAKFDGEDNSTKLVTFLGKGGSGKTTAAVFAAQHYAAAGLSTCLVTHSQNYVAEYLLNCKVGISPVICSDNLSAVRLETTKMLLEPLNKLKQADARLNMTQGVLEGIVGEELGVLPGMDSIFSVFALDRYVRFFGDGAPRNQKQDRYDVVIYDGISTDQTLRMMGAASVARLYLKYLHVMAEKTDLGRLAGPSLLRIVDEAMNLSGSGFNFNGNFSSKIWESLERNLEKGSSAVGEPQKFGCYLVMDPYSPASVDYALHYWGCAIQAGAQISGVFGVASPNFSEELDEDIKNKFLPLPFALVPHVSMGSLPDWDAIMKSAPSKEARKLLQLPAPGARSLMSSIKFDTAQKSITLFMPGFDKSDIKLYQYRGGSELLVEAGDQRRIIKLPREVQGKVRGAKFMDRSLVVRMQ